MNKFDLLFGRTKNWEQAFIKNMDLDDSLGVVNDPYKKSALAYSIISTTGRAISQIPLIVQKYNGKIWQNVKIDDPWQQLFMYPNEMMTGSQFVEALVGYLLLDGNVWAIPFPPSKKIIPASMWVIKRSSMEVKKDNNNQPIYWIYKPQEGKDGYTLYFDEVVQAKFFNPTDPVFGQAPLVAGKLPLEGDFKSSVYNNKFFENGAVPGTVFSTEKNLGTEQRDQFMERIRSNHEGYRKSHRFLLLEGSMKADPIGLTQSDMGFIQLRQYSRDELFQVFGMKKAVLSVIEDVNYATSREQRKEWWQFTNLPIMRIITDSMNQVFFGVNTGMRVIFDITKIEALEEEMKNKIDMAAKLFSMTYPINLIDQILDLGIGPVEWGDVGLAPLNLTPANELSMEPDVLEELVSTGVRKIEGKVIETKAPVPDKKDLAETRKEHIWRNFIAKTIPLEKGFEKKVQRVFFEMRKETLRLLYLDDKSYSDVITEDFEKYGELLQKHSRPFYEDSIKAGIASIKEEMGIDISFSLTDPAALDYLAAKEIEIAKVVTETMKEKIRAALHAGAANGESIDQIADRFKVLFKNGAKRAKVIARTEVVGASNFGRHASLTESGFAFKEWFTSLDKKVRDGHNAEANHVIMHGKRVGMKEDWIMSDGTTLRYPGDFLGPAHQVIQCRCIEVASDEGPIDKPGEERPTEAMEEESVLRDSPVSSSSNLGGGVNESFVLDFGEGKGKGVFKPISGEEFEGMRKDFKSITNKKFTLADREVLAYRVAKEIDMDDMVPTTVMRTTKIDDLTYKGSCQKFVDNAKTFAESPDPFHTISDVDRYRIGVYDYLIGNTDRHSSNWMKIVDTPKPVLIDHGYSFPKYIDDLDDWAGLSEFRCSLVDDIASLYGGADEAFDDLIPDAVKRKLVDRIRKIDIEDLAKGMHISKGEIAGFKARQEMLLFSIEQNEIGYLFNNYYYYSL